MDKPAFPTADTEKMMSLPLGAVSPLWLMFAGAATVGAAFYWSKAFFKPTNLEALIRIEESAADAVVEEIEDMVEVVEAMADTAEETLEEAMDVATEVVDDLVEATPEPVEHLMAALMPEPVAPMTPAKPDDLTRLTGIGPKLAAAFSERGVTRFADIAAWSEDDIARFDKELKLMGRVTREAWIAQAKRYAEA
ncbi:MAG: helix-hairpin-helix domain-containing protein [Caulobacter sp.]|nr:helix-hairpin-helix domain-containing protein [Caulobacter sp.]MDP1964790.1 helix-hairpin-helix domain-containing protein [Reyranella sp.]